MSSMDEEKLGLDNDGFMTDITTWNREKAHKLAKLNNLEPLTDDHWKIIEFVKEYFTTTGLGPPVVKISKATGLSSNQICTLFTCGVAKGAYRLAGLPRPTGCL